MKITLLLLILAILLINPVNATSIEKELYEKESFEIAGYNITLMGVGNKERSIVACVNNEIFIIDKDEKREIENLKIRPERIYGDYAKLQITYSEEGTCDESCSNNVCLGNVIPEKQNELEESQENTTQENQQTTPKNNTTLLSVGLFLFVLILLIILLIKKKR